MITGHEKKPKVTGESGKVFLLWCWTGRAPQPNMEPNSWDSVSQTKQNPVKEPLFLNVVWSEIVSLSNTGTVQSLATGGLAL